jgi:hypothetical protein
MTRAEFTDDLKRLGITKVEFALQVGSKPNTAHHWCEPKHPVPYWIQIIVKKMLEIQMLRAQLASKQEVIEASFAENQKLRSAMETMAKVGATFIGDAANTLRD